MCGLLHTEKVENFKLKDQLSNYATRACSVIFFHVDLNEKTGNRHAKDGQQTLSKYKNTFKNTFKLTSLLTYTVPDKQSFPRTG